ncbi:MAG: hypothetical protein R8K21_01095 [Mariprofundales bacterium]
MEYLVHQKRNHTLEHAIQCRNQALDKNNANLFLQSSSYYKQVDLHLHAAEMCGMAVLTYIRTHHYNDALNLLAIYGNTLHTQSKIVSEILSSFPSNDLPEHIRQTLAPKITDVILYAQQKAEVGDFLEAAEFYHNEASKQQDAKLFLQASACYQQAEFDTYAIEMCCTAALIHARNSQYYECTLLLLVYTDIYQYHPDIIEQIASCFPSAKLPAYICKCLHLPKKFNKNIQDNDIQQAYHYAEDKVFLLAAEECKRDGLKQQNAKLLLSAALYYKKLGNIKRMIEMYDIAVIIYARTGYYNNVIKLLIEHSELFQDQTAILTQLASYFPKKTLPANVRKKLHINHIICSNLPDKDSQVITRNYFSVDAIPEYAKDKKNKTKADTKAEAELPPLPVSLLALLAQEKNVSACQEIISMMQYETLSTNIIWQQACKCYQYIAFIIKGSLNTYLEIGEHLSDSLEISCLQRSIGKLKTGDMWGAQAYYANTSNIVNVISRENSVIVTISFQVLNELLPRLPYLKQYIYKEYVKYLGFNHLLLSPLLAQLPSTDVKVIAVGMEAYYCKAGTALFIQGNKIDYIYLLRIGHVISFVNILRTEVLLSISSHGELLGDVIVASAEHRVQCSAYCINDCSFWRINIETMQWCYNNTKQLRQLLENKMINQRKKLYKIQKKIESSENISHILHREIWCIYD